MENEVSFQIYSSLAFFLQCGFLWLGWVQNIVLKVFGVGDQGPVKLFGLENPVFCSYIVYEIFSFLTVLLLFSTALVCI